MKLSIRLLMINGILGKLSVCIALMAFGLHNAHAVTTEPLNCTVSYQIVQTLPNQSKWEMCWEPKPGYGYRLSQIIFTPPNGTRTKVMETMHAAQLFVPYDDNVARYHDISFGVNLALLTAAECPGGSLLTGSTLCLLSQPARVAYKNIATAATAKSNSFALFGYYGIGNYYYTFKYTFLDDGSIEPSVLASGSLERFAGNELTGWPIGTRIGVNHHHLVIWRMDFDVDGTANNVVERVEFSGSGTDTRNMTVTPLATETKDTNNLNALRFWRVRNTAQNNSDGRNISYEIEPSVTDQLRAQEDFTQNDFYLTQYRATEELVDNGLVSFINGETVTDAVLWYGVNFHHVPRGEDDVKMPAHSQGFRIRPRDLTTAVAPTNNNPPVVTNPGNQTTAVNTAVNLPIAATDPNAGDVLSFSASGLPAGLSINSTTGVISGTTGATAATSTATVTVSDGHTGGTSSVSFAWSVTAANTGGQGTFNVPGTLTISDNAPSQPYPVNINVSGLTGAVSKVALTLNGLSHTYPADIDAILVGPAGQKAYLMSDAGGSSAVNNISLTIATTATVVVPNTAIATGTYMPTNYGATTDTFPAPAPAGPYSTGLNVFNGTSPNGIWKLYMLDDEAGDVGKVLNGVTLTVTTNSAPPVNNPPVVTNPGNQTTAVNTAVNLPIAATDPNAGDVLSFSASGLPAGLSINSTTGVISGTTGATAATSTATVTVSDGHTGGTSSVSFAWSVTAANTGGQGTFNVPGTLTISDNAPSQPYPVNINVSGLTGAVSKVALTLNGLSHTYPADIDAILVGPAGQKVLLMSDAGGSVDVSNIALKFETAATVVVPNTAIATGTYMPTNYGATTDTFPAPAPAGPYSTGLNVFNGTSPNGIWKLYMLDDEAGDVGQILNGVTLTVTTN